MAVEAKISASNILPDPDLQMGIDLVAYEKRQKSIKAIKLVAVYLSLIGILMLFLILLNFDLQYVSEHYKDVLKAAVWTLGISLASIAIASILAMLGALGRLSHNVIAQGISGFYVSLIRGTPLLIQIFIIYLGLPQIGNSLQALGEQYNLSWLENVADLFILTAIQSGILALSLNYGAYMTEIFRAGIQSIGHGQAEAARSLGLSTWQTMRRVILPQAVRIIIPDIGNQFIAMQKDSALVSVMGVWEITYVASRVARKSSKFIEMFLIAAALYWILTIVSSWIESWIERRLSHAYER